MEHSLITFTVDDPKSQAILIWGLVIQTLIVFAAFANTLLLNFLNKKQIEKQKNDRKRITLLILDSELDLLKREAVSVKEYLNLASVEMGGFATFNSIAAVIKNLSGSTFLDSMPIFLTQRTEWFAIDDERVVKQLNNVMHAFDSSQQLFLSLKAITNQDPLVSAKYETCQTELDRLITNIDLAKAFINKLI